MKKKNGFIATSLIYSFFLVFITLFLTIIADYLQNKVLLNTIESDIKEEINKTKYIGDFLVGDELTFQLTDYKTATCGSDLSFLSTSNCSSIVSTTLYKINGFETVDTSKIDTLKLENTNDNSIFYIKINELKFSIENSSGIITVTGVS